MTVSKLTRAMVVTSGMLRTFSVASATMQNVPSDPVSGERRSEWGWVGGDGGGGGGERGGGGGGGGVFRGGARATQGGE